MRKHIQESEHWSIRILANYGYSYKFISKMVFGSTRYSAHVGRSLRKQKLRVTDYRNGRNECGSQVAKTVLGKKEKTK